MVITYKLKSINSKGNIVVTSCPYGDTSKVGSQGCYACLHHYGNDKEKQEVVCLHDGDETLFKRYLPEKKELVSLLYVKLCVNCIKSLLCRIPKDIISDSCNGEIFMEKGELKCKKYRDSSELES